MKFQNGLYNEHYLNALEKLTAQLPPTARRVAAQANAAYQQRKDTSQRRRALITVNLTASQMKAASRPGLPGGRVLSGRIL